MPKLWNDTIDAHRQAVTGAILDTAAALVYAHGLPAVTMSRIAQDTGIGRATLYKYFSDVESVLMAWHQRAVGKHLEMIAGIAAQEGDPVVRLTKALETYALISHEHHGSELAALLHRGEHTAHARNHLDRFVTALIAEGVTSGELRNDVPAEELASYCLHALSAASGLPSKAAVLRLVGVTISGLLRHNHP
jgi:AcrR family transcriptional regulator